MEQSTSKLNTELENLSNKLKEKENEIDTDRNNLKNQINEAYNERDLAVKESMVLRGKLTDLLHQKQAFETNNMVQIQSKENKYINDIQELQKALEKTKNQVHYLQKEGEDK